MVDSSEQIEQLGPGSTRSTAIAATILEKLFSDRPLGSGPMAVSPRDLTVTFLVAAAFVVYAVLNFWNDWATDFSAYYYAGRFFHLGQMDQIYAGPSAVVGPQMPELWRTELRADGFPTAQTYPFIYLPWVAWLMAPVAASLPTMTAMNIWLIVNVSLLIGASLLAWRMFAETTRIRLWQWMAMSACLLLWNALTVVALDVGQLQILVCVLVLAAFDRYRTGHVVFAGVLLAIAATIKITPAAFAIIFLWDLNWRALAAFAISAVVVLFGSVAVAGWELHAIYLDVLSRLNHQLFMANGAASLEAFLYQVVDALNGTGRTYVGNEHSVPRPDWLNPVVRGAFAAGLLAIWRLTRRLPRSERLATQFFTVAILLPLCAPLGWVHYYLLAGFAMPALFARRDTVNRIFLIGFLLLFSPVAMLQMILVEGQVMVQVLVYVPFFAALLVLALRRGIAAQP